MNQIQKLQEIENEIKTRLCWFREKLWSYARYMFWCCHIKFKRHHF